MAIEHLIAPVAPDDPVIQQLRSSPLPDPEADYDEDHPLWSTLASAITEHPEVIDVWRLGTEIDAALGASGTGGYAWTSASENLVELVFYSPASEVRRVADTIGALTTSNLAANLDSAGGFQASERDEIIERAAEVQRLIRSAAERGLGLLTLLE